MLEFSEENLQKLIKTIYDYHPNPPFIMPRWWAAQEVATHPERFSVSNDEDRTTTWCGLILYTYGDIYERNQC